MDLQLKSAAGWPDRGTPRHIRAGRAARQAPRGSAVRCRAVRRRPQGHYSGRGTDRGTPRCPPAGPQASAGAGRPGALQECLPALDPATLRGRIGRRADRPGPRDSSNTRSGSVRAPGPDMELCRGTSPMAITALARPDPHRAGVRGPPGRRPGRDACGVLEGCRQSLERSRPTHIPASGGLPAAAPRP